MATSQKSVWLLGFIFVLICAAFLSIALATRTALGYHEYWGMRLTEVPGKFTCPRLKNSPQCAAVFGRRFLANYPRVAIRESGTLKVTLFDGSNVIINEDDGPAQPMELLSNGRLLIITNYFFEGVAWQHLDRASGGAFVTGGYPLFSPDFTHFVSARRSGFESAEFDVYRMTENGPVIAYRENFAVTPWEPTAITWRDNNTIQFIMSESVPDDNLGSIEQRTWATLKRRDGKWQVKIDK